MQIMEETRKRSVLVVVSHDFGELGYAYDFAHTLEGSYNVCFALPQHIYQSNKNLVNFHCIEYYSDTDILAAYKTLTPEYILLFSAFLLVPNNVFSLQSLSNFISTITHDKKVVISSDPFLGFTGSINVSDVNLDLINPSGNIFRQYILKYMTCRQFRQIHSILINIPRLVPFGLGYLDDDTNYYSYYNHDLITNSPRLNEQPYWLFVISEIDYSRQKKNVGDNKCVECLLDKITETSNFDKRPVVIAPLPLLERMKKVKPSLEYIHRCNIIEHKLLIANAERVFYWNMISHSIYHRVVNYKPIHFFDRGHIYGLFPRLHDLAMRCYYQGDEPAIVDYSKPLSIDTLISSNEQFYSTHFSSLEKLRDLPNSIALLRNLKMLKP